MAMYGWEKVAISIHAPTRGATTEIRRTAWNQRISIHAPTRGATASYRSNKQEIKISIHAPTRGATSIENRTLPNYAHFNPRSHKGSDDGSTDIDSLDAFISIHAPTRGATQRQLIVR